jgi:hypothetical protein
MEFEDLFNVTKKLKVNGGEVRNRPFLNWSWKHAEHNNLPMKRPCKETF